MINLYVIFQLFKGRWYGNQIILRKKILSTPTDTTCIHGLAMHINSGDDVSTSCKNLVNVCLVTPEIMELICVPMYLYWAKIDLTPAFVVLPCRNATEYCYADERIKSSNDQATSDINLVGV